MQNRPFNVFFSEIIFDLDGFSGFDSFEKQRTRTDVLESLPKTHISTSTNSTLITDRPTEGTLIDLVENEVEERYGWKVDACVVRICDYAGMVIYECKYAQPPLEENGITRSTIEEFTQTHDLWNDSSEEVREFISQLNYTQYGYLAYLRFQDLFSFSA